MRSYTPKPEQVSIYLEALEEFWGKALRMLEASEKLREVWDEQLNDELTDFVTEDYYFAEEYFESLNGLRLPAEEQKRFEAVRQLRGHSFAQVDRFCRGK